MPEYGAYIGTSSNGNRQCESGQKRFAPSHHHQGSVDQDYRTIARGLVGIAEAISLNSVPWKTVFTHGERSPLWKLEKQVGGGGGGVSGKPAQKHNWKAVEALAKEGSLPVIGPSVMEFDDMETLRVLGAKAISFGAIHLLTPWRPTSFVEREER